MGVVMKYFFSLLDVVAVAKLLLGREMSLHCLQTHVERLLIAARLVALESRERMARTTIERDFNRRVLRRVTTPRALSGPPRVRAQPCLLRPLDNNCYHRSTTNLYPTRQFSISLLKPCLFVLL